MINSHTRLTATLRTIESMALRVKSVPYAVASVHGTLKSNSGLANPTLPRYGTDLSPNFSVMRLDQSFLKPGVMNIYRKATNPNRELEFADL